MKLHRAGGLAVLLFLAALPVRAADYSVKTVDSAPPTELADPVRKLLSDRCVQLLDGKGDVRAEVWFRKDVPARATEAQIKNGLTYREVQESTLVGAIRLPKGGTDYRKQKLPAGVYTLRMGQQPQDGDHMGTAPYSEFLLGSPAAEDKQPGTMSAKALHDLSGKSTGQHPAVFLLFPGKGATADPKVVNKGEGHWVVLYQLEMKVGDKKAVLPIGLTLVGFSSAA
jgi:hypothetical protein